MPYVQISRDKRGYEYFSLVESVVGAYGRTHQRLLYWFRTPPDVKVGREPFDETTRREIEALYPNLVFDWDRLRQTPIPPVPIDWRERRRADKAARRAQRADEAPASDTSGEAESVGQSASVESPPEAAPGAHEPLRNSGRRRRRRRRGGSAPRRENEGGRDLAVPAPDSSMAVEPPASEDEQEGTKDGL